MNVENWNKIQMEHTPNERNKTKNNVNPSDCIPNTYKQWILIAQSDNNNNNNDDDDEIKIENWNEISRFF